MIGMAPTHVQCGECGKRTEIEPGDTAAATVCFWCEDAGKDPNCVTPVALLPCPNGVTAAAWTDGSRSCDDPQHEPKSGMHVIEID